MNREPRWQATSEELHFRTWGDETVVYHNGSGDTHLLGTAEFAILQALKEAPTSPAELLARSDIASDSAEWQDLHAYVGAILAEFEQLGLAVRVAP